MTGEPHVIELDQYPGLRQPICHEDFPLSKVQPGRQDKLGNTIWDVLWLSPDYAIYRTDEGIFVHFSDCPDKAAEQRLAFTTICPELCELRYLAGDMPGTHVSPARFVKRHLIRRRKARRGSSLFDHNIAQSIMLLMEGKPDDAKAIATAALDMAVTRSTNDNTIRYVRASIVSGLILSVAMGLVFGLLSLVAGRRDADLVSYYFIAALYGILGASFSIATRIQSFEMKPCQQSNMNYWMAFIRITIGLIGGLSFFLLAQSALGRSLVNAGVIGGWEGAALMGFIGGFAERLVQTVFQQTAAGIEGRIGTPVQRVRDPVVAAETAAAVTGTPAMTGS